MYSIYFFMAVLLILICGNVGLLLFARAATREADLVVRTALGASRGRIVAQMFAEALVLGSVAAIVGVTAADFALRTWGMVFLETNLGRLPFWFDLSLSPRTFAVAIVLTVAGAAIAGIIPALKITRGMGHRLKQTTAGSGGLQFGGVWTVVIVAQVAATVMFPAVVYMEQSLLRGVQDFDPGFASEQYLAVQIERDYPVDGGSNADAATRERNARLAATLEELRRRVAAQPGVSGVTFTEDLPTTNHPEKIIEMGYDLIVRRSFSEVGWRRIGVSGRLERGASLARGHRRGRRSVVLRGTGRAGSCRPRVHHRRRRPRYARGDRRSRLRRSDPAGPQCGWSAGALPLPWAVLTALGAGKPGRSRGTG